MACFGVANSALPHCFVISGAAEGSSEKERADKVESGHVFMQPFPKSNIWSFSIISLPGIKEEGHFFGKYFWEMLYVLCSFWRHTMHINL